MEKIDDTSLYFNYKSPIGIFVIQFDYNNLKWALAFKNVVYGHYSSPIAAADDVYCKVTGFYDWDALDTIDVSIPTDIYEWERYHHT